MDADGVGTRVAQFGDEYVSLAEQLPRRSSGLTITVIDACRAAAGGAPFGVNLTFLPFFVLAATDPAQPYGAALKWPDTPRRPARQAGAYAAVLNLMEQEDDVASALTTPSSWKP